MRGWSNAAVEVPPQALTANEEDRGKAEEVGRREVKERLGRAEELEVVRERQQLLGSAEGAGRLQLGEEASLLGRREQTRLRDLREHAQLLNALKQAHRRLGNADLAALEDAVLVEAENRPRTVQRSKEAVSTAALRPTLGRLGRLSGLRTGLFSCICTAVRPATTGRLASGAT